MELGDFGEISKPSDKSALIISCREEEIGSQQEEDIVLPTL